MALVVDVGLVGSGFEEESEMVGWVLLLGGDCGDPFER